MLPGITHKKRHGLPSSFTRVRRIFSLIISAGFLICSFLAWKKGNSNIAAVLGALGIFTYILPFFPFAIMQYASVAVTILSFLHNGIGSILYMIDKNMYFSMVK